MPALNKGPFLSFGFCRGQEPVFYLDGAVNDCQSEIASSEQHKQDSGGFQWLKRKVRGFSKVEIKKSLIII